MIGRGVRFVRCVFHFSYEIPMFFFSSRGYTSLLTGTSHRIHARGFRRRGIISVCREVDGEGVII